MNKILRMIKNSEKADRDYENRIDKINHRDKKIRQIIIILVLLLFLFLSPPVFSPAWVTNALFFFKKLIRNPYDYISHDRKICNRKNYNPNLYLNLCQKPILSIINFPFKWSTSWQIARASSLWAFIF